MRTYREFVHKEASFRICCAHFDVVAAEIVRQRRILEEYIERHPAFLTALTPLPAQGGIPEVVRRMICAAAPVGVGPMAAVAGVIAQLACEAGIAAGAREAIVENGGDIFIIAVQQVIIRLYAGTNRIGGRLGLVIRPSDTPLAVCSSSGKMGHSLSFGRCDLATVVAKDCGLADAAATEAANQVQSVEDINRTLQRILEIEGIIGVILIKDDRVGMAGYLPPLIKVRD
ncbi:MAG: UPF0280 family protein [Kiritimatiellia bacterium]